MLRSWNTILTLIYFPEIFICLFICVLSDVCGLLAWPFAYAFGEFIFFIIFSFKSLRCFELDLYQCITFHQHFPKRRKHLHNLW